jgi:adenine-specific DNA-methyltransferase
MPEKNMLIAGDNLPILQSLGAKFQARIQCIYIDPPYNTGAHTRANQQSAGYADRYCSEHWLSQMRPRLEAMHALLAEEGSLFIQLDDNEVDYIKVALDGIFGRENFINRIVVNVRAPSSFSTVNPGLFKASEYLLWYAKDKKRFKHFPMRVPRKPDSAYRMWLKNPKEPAQAWQFCPLKEAHPGSDLDRIRVQHAAQVCRLAPISDSKAGRATVEAKARSKAQPNQVFVVERKHHPPQYLLKGNQLIFYAKQVQAIDGQLCATAPLTNIWTDIPWEGIANEGGVTYKTGKKPERLLRRCLALCTEEGDWVLDAYLGSGSTAAAAHKMKRRWIGIEAGEACLLAKARLEGVCAGEDPSGISRITQWKGGGHFAFYQWDDGLRPME